MCLASLAPEEQCSGKDPLCQALTCNGSRHRVSGGQHAVVEGHIRRSARPPVQKFLSHLDERSECKPGAKRKRDSAQPEAEGAAIKKGIHMKKKLYVGNLSFETTESELKDLFTQSGAVETVRIITDRETGRSKGFGFIEMQEGGDKAIAQMNGKDFNGRALTVNEARPMSTREPGSGGFKRY